MFENEQLQIQKKIEKFCKENDVPFIELQWSRIPFSGHWGISTSFFQIAAQEARQGKRVNVPQRAQEIAEKGAAYLGDLPGFEKIEAVKGYLNLYFTTADYARNVIDRAIEEGADFGRGKRLNQKIMVEFSQPNTHKAFHVGHLRNVILGDAICNILDSSGYDVVRANYIGDIGLHVIKWLWNYRTNHSGETPGEDTTRWMGDIYSEAERYFDGSTAVEAEVRALFARWDNNDAEIVALWEKTRRWSLDGFDQIYNMLGVRFDRFYFESEVEKPGQELVEGLIEQGIAKDERPDGAVIIPLDERLGLEKEKYRVLVILRSDGTSLYSTKDLPLAIAKFEEYDLARSIYVIDVRQALYLQQIFKTLELMDYEWAKDCYHLAYEIVNLPGNVTMSSRDGTVVLLEDLIREATQRALEIVQTKNPDLSDRQQQDIARAVALGALKYTMVSRDNTKMVTFDWDAALDFNGQAAPYIQYAYVRAGSILRRSGEEVPPSFRYEGDFLPVEIELIEMVSRLPDEIQRAAAEYRTLYITNLAYELAKTFNDFYRQCPVLQAEESTKNFRLRLVSATRQAIGNCLASLGIVAPTVM